MEKKNYGISWYFAVNCIAYVPIAADYGLSFATEKNIPIYIILGTLSFICFVAFVFAYNIKTVLKYGGSGTDTYTLTKESLGKILSSVSVVSLIVDYLLTTVIMSVYFAQYFESLFSKPDITENICITIGILGLAALMNYRKIKINVRFLKALILIFTFLFFIMLFISVYGISNGWVTVRTDTLWEHEDIFTFVFLITKLFSYLCLGIIGLDPFRYKRIYDSHSSEYVGGIYRITVFVLFLLFSDVLLGNNYAFILNYCDDIISGYIPVLGVSLFSAIYITVILFILFICIYNTFATVPALAEEIAKDGYFPSMFKNSKDEIMFALSLFISFAIYCIAVICSKGNLDNLLAIYAIGAFISFSLGQLALGKKLQNRKEKFMAYLGFAICFVISVMFIVIKLQTGAWGVLLIIGLGTLFILFTGSYYKRLNEMISLNKKEDRISSERHSSVVIITDFDRGIVPAVKYAKAISKDCRAIYVADTDTDRNYLYDNWEFFFPDVPLIILNNKNDNNVIKPILNYISYSLKSVNVGIITVVIPEYIPKSPFYMIFHRNYAFLLKIILGFRKGIITASVPYRTEGTGKDL